MDKAAVLMSGNPIFNAPFTINIYNDPGSTSERSSNDNDTDYVPRVTQSTDAEFHAHRGENRFYQIKNYPKGRALVVNNEFSEASVAWPKRCGSIKDRYDMVNLWEEMGFEVVVSKDLTAENLQKRVNEFSRAEGEFDFYVVIIMSHGMKDDLVVGTEGGALEVAKIVHAIANSKKLEGKPKLIFFQMCRGPEVETKTDAGGFPTESSDWIKMLLKDLLHSGRTEGSDGTEIDATATEHIEGMKDVLLAFSTQPNYVSLRHPQDGSWFIQIIRRVFAKNAATNDVATLMQMVKDELDKKISPKMTINEKIYRNVKETLDFDHTFGDKILNLYPGFPKAYKEE